MFKVERQGESEDHRNQGWQDLSFNQGIEGKSLESHLNATQEGRCSQGCSHQVQQARRTCVSIKEGVAGLVHVSIRNSCRARRSTRAWKNLSIHHHTLRTKRSAYDACLCGSEEGGEEIARKAKRKSLLENTITYPLQKAFSFCFM